MTTEMNATTKTTLALAKTLAENGFHIPAVEIHTLDGRTWNVGTVPTGRTRHPGFRLFEINRDTGTSREHDAIDGNTWFASDVIDYLRAVASDLT